MCMYTYNVYMYIYIYIYIYIHTHTDLYSYYNNVNYDNHNHHHHHQVQVRARDVRGVSKRGNRGIASSKGPIPCRPTPSLVHNYIIQTMECIKEMLSYSLCQPITDQQLYQMK